MVEHNDLVRKATQKHTPRYVPGLRIARFWKHKETGQRLEVKEAQLIKPENRVRVVLFQPEYGLQTSMFFSELKENYEQLGHFGS